MGTVAESPFALRGATAAANCKKFGVRPGTDALRAPSARLRLKLLDSGLVESGRLLLKRIKSAF